MPENPFSEQFFPNILSKPPQVQLGAISCGLVTCYLEDETKSAQDYNLPSHSYREQ